MDDIKIYYIDRWGMPDIDRYDEENNRDIKQLLIQILVAQTKEDAMSAYVRLYHLCGKRKLRKVLKMQVNYGKNKVCLESLPIFQEIVNSFNEKNLFCCPVIAGILNGEEPFRERVVFATEINYIDKKGTTEEEVYLEFQKKKDCYRKLNEAILRQDVAFLQSQVSLLQTLPSYSWVLSYFSLSDSNKTDIEILIR